MCGILGCIVRQNNLMKTLHDLYTIYKNQESRGTDGAGMLILRDGKIVQVLKFLHPEQFFTIFNASVWEDVKEGDVILMHNRLPTSTSNVLRANHPFLSCDKLLGLVHNGHVRNDSELYEQLKSTHEFKSLAESKTSYDEIITDSEVLVHQMEDYISSGMNLKTAWKKTYKKSTGSITVGFVREGIQAVYLFEDMYNLSVFQAEENEDLFFASEVPKQMTVVRDVKSGELLEIKPDGTYRTVTYIPKRKKNKWKRNYNYSNDSNDYSVSNNYYGNTRKIGRAKVTQDDNRGYTDDELFTKDLPVEYLTRKQRIERRKKQILEDWGLRKDQLGGQIGLRESDLEEIAKEEIEEEEKLEAWEWYNSQRYLNDLNDMPLWEQELLSEFIEKEERLMKEEVGFQTADKVERDGMSNEEIKQVMEEFDEMREREKQREKLENMELGK